MRDAYTLTPLGPLCAADNNLSIAHCSSHIAHLSNTLASFVLLVHTRTAHLLDTDNSIPSCIIFVPVPLLHLMALHRNAKSLQPACERARHTICLRPASMQDVKDVP